MISVEVAPGVTLRIAAPPGAREEPESALVPIDVSAVPGARVVALRGFADGAVTVRAACVVAPSDRWAPGLEELVLGRATGLAAAGLRVPIERWDAGPIEKRSDRFEQRVSGRVGDREAAGIAHTLAFVGKEHEVLVCSVACAAAPDAPRQACASALAGSGVTGALAAAPPPSPLVRSVLFAAEKPYETAAIAIVLGALAIALLLARRPRVPGRRFYP